jgi:hypothetical protein
MRHVDGEDTSFEYLAIAAVAAGMARENSWMAQTFKD